MTDKFNITIKIAGLNPMPLQIKRSDEEGIRAAEYEVNKLWRKLSTRFANLSKEEILAMVAFQFAKSLVALKTRDDAMQNMLVAFESELDQILLDVKDPNAAAEPTLF